MDMREMYLRAARPHLPPTTVARGLKRPLRTTPDELGPCQRYCEELKAEIWRLDRRWAQLKADAFDADRQGHQIHVLSFVHHLEDDE